MKTMKQQCLDASMTCLGIAAMVVAFSVLSGCGKGDKGDAGTTVVVNSVSNTSSIPSDVQGLVDAENVYREGLGQTALTNGLSCTVQLVGSGQWLSTTSSGYNASQGVVTALSGSTSYSFLFQNAFNQPDSSGGVNSIIPTAIQSLFVGQNYKISCTGQLVVTQTGYHNFDMNSDDGSILTVDGGQVINNDGNHGMTDKTGVKFLRAGVHTLNVLYAQTGSGNFGLVLQDGGTLVSGSTFFH